MSTRITQNMMQRSLLADLNDVSNRLASSQRRLSSGDQIERPSDDPYGTGRALDLRSALAGLRQHQRNADEAQAWVQVSDSALARIGDAAQRARELAIGGATDTSSQAARNAAAAEIDQLADAIKEAANTRYGDHYVFAGAKTSAPPYTTGGGDAYAGDGAAIAREIGPGVSVAVNVVGQTLLGDGTAAADGKLLDTLRGLAAHLRGGTPADAAALRSTDIQGLDRGLDAISSARGQLGAIGNRIESAGSRLAALEESTTRMLSDVEDADMAKTLTDFSTQQAVYQSALKAGANLVQASLLDFLR